MLGTPSISLQQRQAAWHPVPQWDPTAHRGPVSRLASVVPHCLPRGGSLTPGTLSLGWSHVWGQLGRGREKWSHGEGEGRGDLDSASCGAELVWEHLGAHLEKQWFKCPSLAFWRRGDMKALCPSGSRLHQPEGPPWGAVPPPWSLVHTYTPHRGDSPGMTQGNGNKLLSAQSSPWSG